MAVDALGFSNSNTRLSENYGFENEGETQSPKHTHQPNRINFEEISEDILFPSELNEYLRKQIRALTSEKGRFLRRLDEKDKEINILKDQLSSLTTNSSCASEQNLATRRLGELSKKVRELTAQLERQKAKRHEAEALLASSQTSLLQAAESQIQNENQTPSNEINAAEPQETLNSNENNKNLREKLNQCQMRLCESRNQNQQLKQELKLAHKVLANELGEEVNLAQLSNNMVAGSWRGRQQQIIALQQKVNELTEKWSALQDVGEKVINRASIPPTIMVAAEARAAHARERSEAISKMQSTIQENQEELKDLKSRLEASKARSRVLETDQNSLRQRLSTMLEKEQHDQQLISALTTQLSAAEDQGKRKCEKHEHDINEALNRANRLQQELTREVCKTRQLEETLREKDGRIKELEHRLAKEIELSKSSAVPDNTNLESLKDLQNSLSSSEQERNRLIELVNLLNRRISEQQASTCELEVEMLSYKNQCQRLHARISAIEMEKAGPRRRSTMPSNFRMKELETQNLEDTDINSKIELLSEQILTLRERVRRMGQEREEDLRKYLEIFGQENEDVTKPDSPRTAFTDIYTSTSMITTSKSSFSQDTEQQPVVITNIKKPNTGIWASKNSTYSKTTKSNISTPHTQISPAVSDFKSRLPQRSMPSPSINRGKSVTRRPLRGR